MAGIAGLDEVLARTGMSVRCLRLPCNKEHLLEIAKRLTNWRNAAPWLGLDPASVETWDYDGHLNEEGKRQKMFTEWKQRRGCEATYEALANVLLKVDRTDLAEELLDSLKDHLTSTNSHGVLASSTHINLTVNPVPRGSPCSSAHSTPHSSRYTTPQHSYPASANSTPTHSALATPSAQYSANTSLLRSAQHSTNASPLSSAQHSANASPYNTLPRSAKHHISLPGGGDLPQDDLPFAGFMEDNVMTPIQMQTQEPFSGSNLCVPQHETSGYYYSTMMQQRFGFVCEVGGTCGMPPQSTVEIQQLNNRVQQLEVELQNTKQRYDREINYYKMEQEYERREHEGMVHLLKQQRHNAEANARHFESLVGQLVTRLKQMEFRCLSYEGQDSTDSSQDSDISSTELEDPEEKQYRAMKSIVCEVREEIKRTVVCVVPHTPGSESDGSTAQNGVPVCAEEVFEKLHQFQLRLEEKQTRVIKCLERRQQSEVAANSIHFLAANGRLTEIVSQSLESISDSPECSVLGEDLRWLQRECDTLRCASWP